jgi:cell division protein FtsZ
VSDLQISGPILVVGIGGAGAKLARAAKNVIECDCLIVSNDKRDLGDENSVFVNSGKYINPSTLKLRSFVQGKADQLRTKLEGFGTIIVMANLAGKAGAAMAPIICNLAKSAGTVITFAVMPFGFENDRMFHAGVALRRVRNASHSTVVLDNDAFLDNNAELSKQECYSLTNSAIIGVVSSLSSQGARPDMNILCTSKPGDSEASLRDSVSMLYRDVAGTDAIKRTVIYVMGGDKLPISALNQLVSYARDFFKEEGTTEVAMSSLQAVDGVRVSLVASAPQKTRFDSYDPLGEIIPIDSHLDWDEPDSAPEIQLAIPVIE